MSVKFEIVESGNEILAYFPYELKDQFRSAFRSAKWDSGRVAWKVGTRSRKRLNVWFDEVRNSGIIEELDARDVREFDEKELESLRRNLMQLECAIGVENAAARNATALAMTREEFLAQLKDKREVLEAAACAKRVAMEKAKALDREVMAIVSQVAGVAEIESLRSGMRYDWREQRSVNRSWFEEKQARLEEIDDELEEAGIFSKGLRAAVNANWNRRDRDLPDLSRPIEFEMISAD